MSVFKEVEKSCDGGFVFWDMGKFNVVRFDRFLRGKRVVIPFRLSEHSDDRLPLKGAVSMMGEGSQPREIVNLLRRGIGQG